MQGKLNTLADFWSYVDRHEPSLCWPWKGTIDAISGRPRFNLGGRRVYAYRTSYALSHGQMPIGKEVGRTCGNIICVNPNHLIAVQSSPNRFKNDLRDFWVLVSKEGTIPVHRPELGPCWPWTGTIATTGYGTFRLHGRNVATHRLSFQILKGQIPKELVIDHLCRNRVCVNPNHMELVTNAENIKRGNIFRCKERELAEAREKAKE